MAYLCVHSSAYIKKLSQRGKHSLGSNRGIFGAGAGIQLSDYVAKTQPSRTVPAVFFAKFVSQHKMQLAAWFLVRGEITKVICFHCELLLALNS